MFLGFNVLGHILEYWRYKCQILVGSTSLVKVQLQHSIYPDQLQFNFVRLIYFLCSILNQYHVDIKIVFDLMHHFYMDSFNKETFILSSNKTTKHIFARSYVSKLSKSMSKWVIIRLSKFEKKQFHCKW